MIRFGLQLAWLAALICGLAIATAGAASAGYSSLRHPISVLGSSFSSQHAWFNPVGFVLPGLMVAGLAVALECSRAFTGRAFRIGTGLILLAGLAFAMQAVFALDPADLDSDTSRLHTVMHALFRLAALAATTLLGLVLLRRPQWRVCAVLGLLFALALSLDLLAPRHRWGFELVPGAVERGLVALWYAWLVALGVTASRASRGT